MKALAQSSTPRNDSPRRACHPDLRNCEQPPCADRTSADEQRLRELLLQGLAGDSDAYREFLTELSGRLRAFLRKRLSRLPDEVEDLLQESLLAVHNQRHTYLPAQPVTPWAYAIARYKLIDFLRHRSCTDVLTEPLDEESEWLARDDSEASDARRDLATLLHQLPERQRLPIVYVKLEGLSVDEAAHRSGMSVSAVKVGVHRGFKALAAIARGSS